MIRFYLVDMWYDATLSVNADIGGDAFVTSDGPDLGRSQSFFALPSTSWLVRQSHEPISCSQCV